MYRVVFHAAAVCLCAAAPAFAQNGLTFEAAVARAREQAGSVLVARARVAEAEAALVDASARYRTNPALEVSAGPRFSASGRMADVDVGVSQQFENGAQRAARIMAARAGIDRERATVDEAVRLAVFDAASAYLEAVAAQERVRIAVQSDEASRQLTQATERRYAVGDISAIDLNQVRIDVTRAASAAAAARAAEADAILHLKRLLRSQSFDAVQGTLDLPRPPAEDASRMALERRPDLAALAAELRAADAEAQLGRALTRPELGARLGYQRDDGDSIVVGGLTITLPAFQRGQGLVAAGRARAARAKVEIEMAREHALAELDRAYAAYVLQQRAAELASAGLTAVDDNENLARRSYEAGEMGLLDYLLIRRDAFQTRTAVVDRRLEVARSRITIDFISGVLR